MFGGEEGEDEDDDELMIDQEEALNELERERLAQTKERIAAIEEELEYLSRCIKRDRAVADERGLKLVEQMEAQQELEQAIQKAKARNAAGKQNKVMLTKAIQADLESKLEGMTKEEACVRLEEVIHGLSSTDALSLGF